MPSGSGARESKRDRISSTAIGGGPAQERTLRAQGRRTLRRLLEAALVVFDKRGYHGARVDDICAEANTSHGTFYLYFSSKEDLFRALLNDVSEQMVALSESLPSISPDVSGRDALRAFLSSFFDIYRHHHPVIRAWMDAPLNDVELAEMGAGVLGGFAAALARRIGEVRPPIADPDTAALAATAMVERFSFYSVMSAVTLDPDQMLDTMASLLHVGLFGGVRPPS